MSILTFLKNCTRNPDTASILEFTEVKASGLFVLYCGIFEAVELDIKQAAFSNVMVPQLQRRYGEVPVLIYHMTSLGLQFSEVRNSTKHKWFTYIPQDF